MAAYTTQLTSGPSLFFLVIFCFILFLLRQTAIGSFRIKTVFLKYIMWDFLKITIIQYADVVTVTYRRIVAVQALDEKT